MVTRIIADEIVTENKLIMKTGLVGDPVYREHVPGKDHPESPERYDVVMKGVEEQLAPDAVIRIAPRRATEEEVELVHTRKYIETARHDILSGWGSLSTGDTDVCRESYDVALLAAGGVLNAVDAVMAAKVRNACCIVRPPGHHAMSDTGMGFCVFNNVAIAARYVQKKHGIGRVLIVDWDIHHGNGTQEIFLEDPSVFYFSTHMWPFYPGTGAAHESGLGKGKGFTMNCPLGAGSGRKEYVDAFNEKLVPAMRTFKPEFVLISAGFDGMANDPIGRHLMKAGDYAELTGIVMGIAAEHACERLVSTLEGGYNLADLKDAVGRHVARLSAPS